MNSHSLRRSVEFIDSWLAYRMKQAEFPGLSIAIWKGEDELFSQAYGLANSKEDERLTVDHTFAIGSQSKMLTAATIIQLERLGRLRLDEPAVKYVPWLKRHADPRFTTITIRQLLQHEAGLARDTYPADFWQLQAPFPNKSLLKELTLTSVFHPSKGARFKYSNLGYALLGLVIEAASGISYDECVKAQVLRPMVLEKILTYDDSPKTAMGYLRSVSGYRLPVSLTVPTYSYMPVAGWFASPSTIGHFLSQQMMQLKSKGRYPWETQKNHWRPASLRGTPYGYGFMSYEYLAYHLVGHSGSFIGHSVFAFFDLATKLTVVVMANAKDAPVGMIGEGIFGVFDYFSQYGNAKTPKNRERLNGRLMNLWQTVEIVATEGRIVSIDPDSWVPFEAILEELTPVSPIQFKVENTHDLALLDETITFHFSNNTTHLDWVDYGGSTTVPEGVYHRWLAQRKNTDAS